MATQHWGHHFTLPYRKHQFFLRFNISAENANPWCLDHRHSNVGGFSRDLGAVSVKLGDSQTGSQTLVFPRGKKTKCKVFRGKGKSFSIKFRSESSSPVAEPRLGIFLLQNTKVLYLGAKQSVAYFSHLGDLFFQPLWPLSIKTRPVREIFWLEWQPDDCWQSKLFLLSWQLSSHHLHPHQPHFGPAPPLSIALPCLVMVSGVLPVPAPAIGGSEP